jgi:hypothetical protein
MTGAPSRSITAKGKFYEHGRGKRLYSRIRYTVNTTDLHVLLDIWVIETTTDQSLGVENGVGGVHSRLPETEEV